MRTYFSPWQTSTANVTKPFLRKPAHPLRLNIGTLQNLWRAIADKNPCVNL